MLLFLSVSHAWTVASLVSRARHEVAAVAAQSASTVEAAIRSGDLIGLRNSIGNLRIEGIPRVEFHGPAEGALGRFAEFTIGTSGTGTVGILKYRLDLASNGASLGHINYEVDLFTLNSRAIGGNWVLYGAAVLFMTLMAVLANLGTIRVLSQVESVLSGISGGVTTSRAHELSSVLEKSARAAASDPVLQSLFGLLAQYSQQIETARKAEADMALAQEVEALATMVAHDIRAPLAALETIISSNEHIRGHQQALARTALTRIEEIADDVLGRARSGTAQVGRRSATSVARVESLLGAVADEFALRPTTGQRLRADRASSRGLIVQVEPKSFVRVLSNICNNALEAVGASGAVLIGAKELPTEIEIFVTDDGPGIPPDILSKLGQRGATFGKEGGNGLGLWHAKTTVESWGGRLEIESQVGTGTTVRLILPRAEAPHASTSEGPAAAILIDDDPLVRMNWGVAAKRAGKTLKAYADAASFIEEAGGLPRDTTIYLDSDLGGGVKGEEAARELAALGFTELYLETGHDPASFPSLPHLKAVRGKEPPWTAA